MVAPVPQGPRPDKPGLSLISVFDEAFDTISYTHCSALSASILLPFSLLAPLSVSVAAGLVYQNASVACRCSVVSTLFQSCAHLLQPRSLISPSSSKDFQTFICLLAPTIRLNRARHIHFENHLTNCIHFAYQRSSQRSPCKEFIGQQRATSSHFDNLSPPFNRHHAHHRLHYLFTPPSLRCRHCQRSELHGLLHQHDHRHRCRRHRDLACPYQHCIQLFHLQWHQRQHHDLGANYSFHRRSELFQPRQSRCRSYGRRGRCRGNDRIRILSLNER